MTGAAVPEGLEPLAAEFTFLGELGRGGMAVVYHARDRSLHRDVAIKVLRAGAATQRDAMLRFKREARVAAGLHHPNIVPVFGVRSLGPERIALIMRLVAGSSLKERLTRGARFSFDEVRRVARDVAAALEHAHALGVIHRDVKPANVFFDTALERWLLADFGIARATDESTQLTLTGTALGTPNYMSPEQIEGSSVDARSDIYSFGLLLWETLTGTQPWEGESLFNVIYKQKHEPLGDVRALRADTPTDLAEIIANATAKQPARRPATAAEILERLDSGDSGVRSASVGPVSPDVVVDERPASTREETALFRGPAGSITTSAHTESGEVGDVQDRARAAPPRWPGALLTDRVATGAILLGIFLLAFLGVVLLRQSGSARPSDASVLDVSGGAPVPPGLRPPLASVWEEVGAPDSTVTNGASRDSSRPMRSSAPVVVPDARREADDDRIRAEPQGPSQVEPDASDPTAPGPVGREPAGEDDRRERQAPPPPPQPPVELTLDGPTGLRVGESVEIRLSDETGQRPSERVAWDARPRGVVSLAQAGDRGARVTGEREGQARIRVSAGPEVTAVHAVTVAGYAVDRIEIDVSDSADPGDRLPLRATTFGPAGNPLSDAPIRWASSQEAVARISGEELLVVGAGSTVISASAGGVTGRVTLSVAEPPPPDPGPPLDLAIQACVAALESGQSDRIRAVYATSAERDRQNLDRLLGRRDLRLEGTEPMDAIMRGEESAIATFRLRLSWRGFAGQREAQWMEWEVSVRLSDREWTSPTCRLVGNPAL